MSNTSDQGKPTVEGASGYGETGDLAKARSWLERAEAWLLQQTTLDPGPEHATAAAAIGTGYAVLAQVEAGRLDGDPAAAAFFRRAAQAEAEARPHDGEACICESLPEVTGHHLTGCPVYVARAVDRG